MSDSESKEGVKSNSRRPLYIVLKSGSAVASGVR